MAEEQDESQWPIGFEGHAREQRKRMAALPLSAKIAWLEEAQRVAEHLQRSRRERLPHPYTKAQAMTITIDGCPLAVHDEGSGPAIVFLHGFPLDHRMWEAQLPALPGWRKIVPDLRGFGASGVTPGTVTMDRFADDVAGILDALAIPKAVICGLSMGGYIALAFWRRHAARVSGLVLCDTRAVPDTEEAAAGRRKSATQVLAEGSKVAAEAVVPKLFAKGTQEARPELLVEYRALMSGMPPAGVAAAQLGMAERPDSRPTLPTITVPTQVIVGIEDVISTPAEMQSIAAGIPGAEYSIIAGAGHMSPVENPSEFNFELLGFLERVQ